jgi:hypothetical protein
MNNIINLFAEATIVAEDMQKKKDLSKPCIERSTLNNVTPDEWDAVWKTNPWNPENKS